MKRPLFFILVLPFPVLTLLFTTLVQGSKADAPRSIGSGTISEIAHVPAEIFNGVMATQGGYVYAGMSHQLVVLDVSNPANITPVGQVDLEAPVSAITLYQHYAYVTLSSSQYKIIDISNPANPVIYATSFSGVKQFIFDNSRLYVNYSYCHWAGCSYGFNIYDNSNPAQPAVLGGYYQDEPASNMVVYGHYVYFASANEIKIFDISDPSHVLQVGTYALSGDISLLDSAYLLVNVFDTHSIDLLDLSDPLNPTPMASHPAPVAHTVSLSKVNDLLYAEFTHIGFSTQFTLLTLPDLTPVASFQFSGEVTGRVIVGDKIYAATETGDLYIFTITGNTLTLVSQTFISFSRIGVASDGGYVYTISPDNYLRIYSMGNPSMPQLVGFYQKPFFHPGTTRISGIYAYVLDEPGEVAGVEVGGRLHIFDISHPASPVEVGVYTLVYSTWNGLAVDRQMAIYDHYLVITNPPGRVIEIVDVNDPTHPTAVYVSGKLLPNDDAFFVEVQDEYAYFSSNFSSAMVADLTNPAAPILAGTSEGLSTYVLDTTVSGNNFYLGTTDALFRVDVSTPAQPTLAATIPGQVDTLAIAGDYLHVGTPDGMQVWLADFQDTSVPIGNYSQGNGSAIDSFVENDHAYVLQYLPDAPDILDIFNISDLSQPTVAASYSLDSLEAEADGTDLEVDGRFIYLSSRLSGWHILEFDGSYSASGHLFTLNHRPIMNVSVSAGTELTTTTDENGRYAFHNLMPNRTLTPTLLAFTFSPPTQTVPLLSDHTALNFYVLPEPDQVYYTPTLAATLVYTSIDGLVTEITIPAGAISTPMTITLSSNLPESSLGTGFLLAGHAFVLKVESAAERQPALTFDLPVIVILHYSDGDIYAISDEIQLALWHQNAVGWQAATLTCTPASISVLNINNNTLTLPICQPGQYAFFGPTYHLYLPVSLKL